MSTTIDQRVVEMRFDNKHFESNVATTMTSLDNLNKSLNMTGATKGLENVDAAAKRVNLAPLSQAAEVVTTKFSYMQMTIQHQLNKIVDSAVATGKRVVSALTIDPIKTGLQEYETQVNAVQTILANTESKGTTLGQVNAALDELNTYADKTIYNFTEMTRNIGTFTAAGVDLNTSVNAIQGIANLAAVSGSTSQQASTAMYQLSQALSSGTVKLMDWNSVVNAGMGGQVFQDALKETARAHGVAVDDMIKKNGSFRESLQEGWITSEILTETLSHFTMAAEEGSEQWEKYKKSLMDDGYSEEQANAILKLSNTATAAATKVKTASQLWETLKETAQSGWTQTWEIILGDFGEAKKLFSGIYETLSPILEEMAKSRNELLSGGLSSGWKQLLSQGIADEEGYRDSIKNVAKDHGIAIDDMIKAEKELDSSLDDNEAFQKVLQKGLKDGSINSDMLSESVTNLADKMRNMTEEEREAAGYTQEHITQIEKLEKGLKDGSVSMDEFAEKMMKPSGRENIIDALYNTFKAVLSIISPIKQAFSEIFPALKPEQLYAFTEALRDFTAKLTLSETASENLKRTFKGLFAVFDIIRMAFVAVIELIAPLFGGLDNLGGGILSTTAKLGDWLVALRDSIKEGNVFGKAVDKIHGALDKVRNAFNKVIEFLQPVVNGVKEAGAVISSVFSNIRSNSEKKLEPLKKLGLFIEKIFSGINELLGKISPFIQKAASGVGNVIKGLLNDITSFIQNSDYKSLFNIINGGVFTAFGIGLIKFIGNLKTIVSDGGAAFVAVGAAIKTFITGAGSVVTNTAGIIENIKNLFGGVGDAINAFTKKTQSEALKNIAVSIAILAAALLVLSLINPDRMASSIVAITALFAELSAALAIFGKISNGKGFNNVVKSVAAITALSVALLILSAALKIMSTMSWSEMGVGLTSLTVGLGVLTAAVYLLPERKVNKSVKTIKKLSSALIVFSIALKIMSTMSWSEMGVGLISTVVGLGSLVAAVNLLPRDKFENAAKTIRKLSFSLIILAAAMKIMGTMSWKEMGVALITTATSLGVLVATVNLLPKDKFANAATMIQKFAISLVILAVAMKIMGTMSWKEMGVGLITTVASLGALVAAVRLLPKDRFGNAATEIQRLSISLVILAAAMKIMGTMSWKEMGVGLISTVVGLGALVAAVRLLPKDMTGKTMGILILSTALVVLASALKKMGGMSWEEIAKGLVTLGGSLGIIAAGMALMKSALPGAAAMLVVSAALAVLAPVLLTLGAMSWESIARGLVVLAGAFAVIGIAGLLLKPLVPTLLGLAGTFALFGVGLAAIGAGVFLVGVGLATLASALAVSGGAIVIFVTSIISLIPYLFEQLGVAIVKLCEAISASSDAICKAFTVIVIAIVDALVASIPAVVDGIMILITSLIESMRDYVPTLVDAFMDFMIAIMNGIVGRMPELVKSGTDILLAMFVGIIEALKSVDTSILVDGITAIGLLLALIVAMAMIASLTPAAMIGVIGAGAVLAELAIVLAAVGALAQIPGLDWLISEGGNFLQTVGTAIGKFLGGLAGGFSEGMSSALPQIGTDLSTFMTNAKPFFDGAKSFNASTLDGVKSLIEVIGALTALNIIDGLTSWITGGSSLTKFGEELAAFAPNFKTYADTISGIDGSAVTASAAAATAIAEMTKHIPNEGGMVAWFTGENSISKFGNDLIALGEGLKSYSDSISGFDPEAVTASAAAATAIAEMTKHIPNEGGVVAWFTGENSISKFGNDLIALGGGLKSYSDSISGFDPEAVIASANAATAIAEMTKHIPNEGGMIAWFAGDNSISKFGNELVILGASLAAYSMAITGFNAEAVIASANAAMVLADMTSHIPNEGGMMAWFAGENSVAKFGVELVMLATGLSTYSSIITGFNADAVIASANAAKALVDMTSCIPNEGGMVAWFTGDNSISKFGNDLILLGEGLKSYSDSIVGFNPEAVTASANAAKAIADMTSHIPTEGGLVAWFTGDNSVSKFAGDLSVLGEGLKSYSDSIVGFNAEAVTASANAAMALADMTSHIPNEGGMKAWFTGDSSISKFGNELVALGEGLKSYSDSIVGFNPEAVTASANAATAIADMTSHIPNEGGMVAWFTGETSISKFGEELVALGEGLKSYSDSIVGFNPEAVTASANAAAAIADMTAHIPTEGGIKAWFAGEASVSKFSDDLPALGEGLKGFSDSIEGINAENITAAAGAAKALAEMASYIPNEGGLAAWFKGDSSVAAFADQLPTLGEGLKGFSDSIEGIVPENVTAAANAAKTLAEMAETAPADSSTLTLFGANLVTFGEDLNSYFKKISDVASDAISTSASAIKSIKTSVTGLNPDNLSAASKGLDELVKAVNKMSKVKSDAADGFSSAIKKIAKTNVKNMVDAFKGAASDMTKAGESALDNFIKGVESKNSGVKTSGQTAIDKFISGIESKKTKVKTACEEIASAGAEAIKDKYDSFKSSGKYLVEGFADGITAKTWHAEAKARAMAKAAAKAAEKALDINSPSKVFRSIGYSVPEGFAQGIDRMGRIVTRSSVGMATNAVQNVKNSISRLSDLINTDINSQPTIRPVLDLSNVRSGASAINGMFGNDASVGVLANVSSISSMMNGRGLNATNDDVVSAIDKLRKDLGNIGNTTYQVNGITYDDGSNVSSAIESLVRYAKIERRV